MKTKTFKFMCLLLSFISLFGVFTSINPKAEGEDQVKTLYELNLKSSYQVKSGGKPEYTITNNDTGEAIRVIVDTVDGTSVSLEKGVYTIKEVKTTDGFVPQIKEGVVLTLPHYDENGKLQKFVQLDMKSEKIEQPIVWYTYKPEEKKKEEPKKEEPKKEEPKDEGTPILLTARKEIKKDEPKEEEPPVIKDETKTQEKPIIEPKTTNPKTGDGTFTSDWVLLCGGIVLLVGAYILMKKTRKDKESN